MTLKSVLTAVFLLVLGGAVLAAENELTYADLVNRLTDLEYVATLPVPGEHAGLCSSYDRTSSYDAVTGKYLKWDANADGKGYIRKEGDSFVMAEMTGPGCIWRIWSATPAQTHVKIYLDGAAEPAVDLPFVGYFDRKNAPFTYPSMVYKTAADGFDCLVPIPYNKSCKVVADKAWGDYFQFTYTTFAPGTVVPTFTRKLASADAAALQAADQRMSAGLGNDPHEARPGLQTKTIPVELAPGQTTTAASLTGPRAITSLGIQLDPASLAEAETVLRAVTMSIHWDGEASPSVWSPLGDFFGTAPGVNLYRSLPLGMTDKGFYSHWYMPFATSARIDLRNDGKTPVKLTATLTDAPLTRPLATLSRFHAKWHRDAFLPAEPERKIDWPMLKTAGRGRFCGVTLNIWNPEGQWWGEGDDKFFVDGEKFPSIFGTGSEDYFGYAWGSDRLFSQATHSQTHCDKACRGHVSVNRWHIADNVPFQTGIEASIEKYFDNRRPTQYDAVAYWYQAPGETDLYKSVPPADRVDYYTKLVKTPGALEFESFKVVSKFNGELVGQAMGELFDPRWSEGKQKFWYMNKVGDRLVLAVPVAQTGRMKLTGQFTTAPDYGIIQLYWDGEKLGEPHDFYSQKVAPTGEIDLGAHDMTAGTHQFTIEIVGRNPASRNTVVGMDYLKMAPEK
jgi:hypothetical protein